jgi:pyruvate-formate lyase-activating enzyme
VTADETPRSQSEHGWFARLPRWGKAVAILTFPLWLKLRWVLRDRWAPRSYYCRALAGESDYDICINSDLTVSCNCQDFSGDGHIGDLGTETLEQIFAGPTVAGFQQALAAGHYPTSVCRRCSELTPLPAGDDGSTHVGRVPSRGIMLENTVRCNLRCALCAERRDGLVALRERKSLRPEDVEAVSGILRRHGIERLFYFNLNEPFLSRTILDEMRVIREQNPAIWIVTSTNGTLLDTAEKIEAALLMDYVYVSIDGVDRESASRYQAGGDFDRSFENMRRLCAERSAGVRERDGVRLPIVEWKYVMFRWNDSHAEIVRAIELARTAGVDLLGFAPGGGSWRDRSLRYHLDPLVQGGTATQDGMVINLAGIPDDLLTP